MNFDGRFLDGFYVTFEILVLQLVTLLIQDILLRTKETKRFVRP